MNHQFICVPRLSVNVVISAPLLFIGQDLGQVSGSVGVYESFAASSTRTESGLACDNPRPLERMWRELSARPRLTLLRLGRGLGRAGSSSETQASIDGKFQVHSKG